MCFALPASFFCRGPLRLPNADVAGDAPALLVPKSPFESERWTESLTTDGFPAIICRQLPQPSFLGVCLLIYSVEKFVSIHG